LRVVKGQNTFASSNQLKSSTMKTILLSPLFTIGAFFTVSLNAQNCNASFTYTVSGNTVYFNNTSDSGTYVMSWLFGDNITGTGNNPSHTYANAGTYNVCLIIMNQNQQFCDSTYQTIVVQPSSISEQFNGTAITIAPNPATDFINVSFSATAGITTFEILDIAGRVVMTEELTTSGSVVHAINVQPIPAGAYYIRLTSGNMVGGKRILISK
jgi:PKD repeat protein